MAEHRFRDPQGNEWVTIDTPSDEVLAAYPEGTVEMPMVPVPTPELPSLDEIKSSLKASIDTAAEIERRKYITPGSGQAMEYWEAAGQAKEYLAALAADPDYAPPPGTYKMLEASIGIDGETLEAVATLVAEMYEDWVPIGAAIRSARLGTKAAIDAAATAEEAQAAAEAVVWP